MFRIISNYLPLLLAITLPVQAQAAVTFALRGNSLTPRYAAGGKASANYLSNVYASTPAAVENFGHASVFGGQAINLIGLSDTRSLLFNSYGNWITGSNVFSALFRIVPNWTGNPAGLRRIVRIGQANSPAWAGGLLLEIQTDGKLFAVARDASDKGTLLFSFTTASALSFTSGTATDIMIVSDGARVYLSQDGVEIHDAALTSTAAQLGALVGGAIWLGPYPWDGSYNEVVIWNTAEPHEYAARTDFISVADFDGTSATDPGIANVRSGTTYTIAGASLTGTAAIPAAADVKIGVSVGAATGLYDGSDRWTCPLAGQLSNGTQLKCNSTSLNLTGTLDNVTNVLSSQTMTGASTSGVLVVR